jgi:hypothetical protein
MCQGQGLEMAAIVQTYRRPQPPAVNNLHSISQIVDAVRNAVIGAHHVNSGN